MIDIDQDYIFAAHIEEERNRPSPSAPEGGGDHSALFDSGA
jgi:hypothetical protein